MSQQEIRLVEEAKQDLHAGKQFYDHVQEGVGAWFWTAFSPTSNRCRYTPASTRRNMDTTGCWQNAFHTQSITILTHDT